MGAAHVEQQHADLKMAHVQIRLGDANITAREVYSIAGQWIICHSYTRGRAPLAGGAFQGDVIEVNFFARIKRHGAVEMFERCIDAFACPSAFHSQVTDLNTLAPHETDCRLTAGRIDERTHT